MANKIIVTEAQLATVVTKLTNEGDTILGPGGTLKPTTPTGKPTYSVVDEPMLGSTNSYIHTGVKQADDAKDSEIHVVDDKESNVQDGPGAIFEDGHEMPEEWMDELEDETGVQRPMSYPEDLPDIEYSSAPAPTTTPVRTPTKTPTPTRPKRQDPFKVPDIKPGEEPAPKAGITMKESDLVNLVKKLIKEAEGKGCAESEGGSGCIKKRGSGWVILNNKKGGVWRKCDSEKHCEEILDAFHASTN